MRISSCLFIATTCITRSRNVRILRILVSRNIVTGRLVRSVCISRPTRPAFMIWKSLPRRSKYAGRTLMTAFTGFPAGKNPYVPVPEVFFTVLLPEIEDSAELKVTLHLFWLLAQKQGNPRCVSEGDLLSDGLLLRSLKRRGDPRPVEDRLRQGLEQAVARGTLLRIHLKLVSEGSDLAEVIQWYFFNTARSRKVVAELQGGEMMSMRLLKNQPEEIEQDAEIAEPLEEYAQGIQSVQNVQSIQGTQNGS